MSQEQVLGFLRDALLTGLILSAPLIVISVLVGLIISIIQAATQVNEQTMTFVPKIIAISLILLTLGPWMMSTLVDFVNRLMTDILIYVK